MKAALVVEALKLRRSLVGIIATLAIVGGTIALLGGVTMALMDGNPQLIAKAGPGATLDWSGLLSSAAQITSAGGLVGFGVVLSWMFAREFTDATINGLFALPTSRGRIAAAKFMVYAAWVSGVAIILTACLLGLGVVLGYGVPDETAWAGLARQLVLIVLTGAVAAPTAWVATVSRSMLAGVGCTIGLVVLAQVSVLAGAGAWMPLAAPALWAVGEGASVTPGQLLLSVALAVTFAVLTCASWARLQMNR
ncbi:MAG: ABC transporter permease [Microbacteriaceae bacterium]